MQYVPMFSMAAGAGYAGGKWIGNRYNTYRGRQALNMKVTKRYRRTRYKKVPRRFKKNLLALKEAKFIDGNSISLQPLEGTSAVLFMTGILEGDTDTARDGSDIYVTSLQGKFSVNGDVDQTEDAYIKLMLVLKKDVRGAILTMAELLETDTYNSMRELDNSKNFKILKTWQRKLSVATTSADKHTARIDFYYKFKTPLRVKYLLSTAVIAAADRNALFLVAMTDAPATFAPVIEGRSRLTFKDI